MTQVSSSILLCRDRQYDTIIIDTTDTDIDTYIIQFSLGKGREEPVSLGII